MKMNNIDEKLAPVIENFDVEKAEKIIEEQLKHDKKNVDLWLKLAVTELCVPLVDYIKSLECIERVLEIDEDNVLAIILKCCIHYFHLGGIDEEIFKKLDSLIIDNADILSIVKYIMSWHYEDMDINKQKELLEESICLCNDYVTNYEELGKIYIKQGDLDRGKKFIKQALNNIKLVYNQELTCDFTDINEYINENLKGIHLSWANKERIEELLN